jgi:hypothetical protein
MCASTDMQQTIYVNNVCYWTQFTYSCSRILGLIAARFEKSIQMCTNPLLQTDISETMRMEKLNITKALWSSAGSANFIPTFSRNK